MKLSELRELIEGQKVWHDMNCVGCSVINDVDLCTCELSIDIGDAYAKKVREAAPMMLKLIEALYVDEKISPETRAVMQELNNFEFRRKGLDE